MKTYDETKEYVRADELEVGDRVRLRADLVSEPSWYEVHEVRVSAVRGTPITILVGGGRVIMRNPTDMVMREVHQS
jgi:hypothetical protein